MEHIVQFAISMDDEAIKKAVAANAERVIIEDLNKQVSQVIFEYRWGQKDGVTRWTEKKFDQFLEEHREEIVAAAADRLANRMIKTKAVKDATAAVVAEVQEVASDGET